MKVRIYPSDKSACGFYRCEEPGRVVAATSDLDIEYCWDPQDEGGLELKLMGRLGNEKVVAVADPQCDVVVLQRPAHRHLVEAIPHIQAHGTAVVCDYDDDFDSLDPRNAAYMHYEPRQNPQQNKVWAKLGSQLADLVTVTTPALAKRYGARGNVAILPNCVPESYLSAKPRWEEERGFDNSVRVGWAGSPESHPGDLEVMGEAIPNVVADENAIFRTIGSLTTPEKVGMSKGTAEVIEWAPIDEFMSYVASFDVGLVPLRDSTFNKAKSYLKGLEYAALGVAFVASPTRPYQELSGLGAGDLVRTTTRNTGAWQEAIGRLVRDSEYRRLRAEEGRIVARDLTYEKKAMLWEIAWRNALTMRRAT